MGLLGPPFFFSPPFPDRRFRFLSFCDDLGRPVVQVFFFTVSAPPSDEASRLAFFPS